MSYSIVGRHSAPGPDLSFLGRAVEYLERAFAHVDRKPETLYNVRQQKCAPIFERHRADYARLIEQGADVSVVLDGIEAIMAELETRRDFGPTLDAVHFAEVDAECHANALQLMAARTRSLADMQRAQAASITELRYLKGYIARLGVEIAAVKRANRNAPRGAA